MGKVKGDVMGEFMPFIEKYGYQNVRGQQYLFSKFGTLYLTEGFLAEQTLMKHMSPYVQATMRRIQQQHEMVLEELSDFFEKYTFMALIGESRHLNGQIRVSKNNLPTPCKKFKTEKVSRIDAWRHAWEVYHAHRLPKKAEVLRDIVELFMEREWNHAFGGKKWGKIGLNLLKLWEGEINTKVFVDTAVTLAHNNEVYLDKLMGGQVRSVRILFTHKSTAPTVYEYCSGIRCTARGKEYRGIPKPDALWAAFDNRRFWEILYKDVVQGYMEFIAYVKGGNDGSEEEEE